MAGCAALFPSFAFHDAEPVEADGNSGIGAAVEPKILGAHGWSARLDGVGPEPGAEHTGEPSGQSRVVEGRADALGTECDIRETIFGKAGRQSDPAGDASDGGDGLVAHGV